MKFGEGVTKGKDKLEKVQLEAARLVTGLPLFASRESLYFETGWEKLSPIYTICFDIYVSKQMTKHTV